ncbi:uncharacterized protein LOC135089871 [Scylla paramamosain]|uniref:uncharacterized protein LOC135089871 n=1 Tax=Scylla paramamosain TaxID=85552 RepID=UPI003083AAD2
MSFYLLPPTGITSLYSLMKDAETRLLYLCQLHQRWGDNEKIQNLFRDHLNLAFNSDCLIEGTEKDCTTSYMLRLAALGDGKFQSFLTSAETLFLEHRLVCGGEVAIRDTISEALTHSGLALESVYLTHSQHVFIQQLQKVLRSLVAAGMNECEDRKLCHHSVKVPWTLVLPLVKTRSVVLEVGQAVVECSQVVQLLCCLFETLFVLGFKQLVASKVHEDILEDKRIAAIIKNLYRLYREHHVGKIIRPSRYLKHTQIEKEARHFPLCMQDLHKDLKRHNRLRHYERYRFTLYLKDIGLPLDENIAFWESYYSKPHSSGSGGCQHAWQGSKNRYAYSIRHMYGLEGRKVNCASHSCSRLQQIESHPQEKGGCPFSTYRPDQVMPLLQPLLGTNTHIEDVISMEMMAGRPSAACKTLMAFTLLKMQQKVTNTTPNSSLEQAGHRVTGEIGLSRLVGPNAAPECGAVLATTTTTTIIMTTQREARGISQTHTTGDAGLHTSGGEGCSRGSAVCDAGCPGKINTAGGKFVVDIEDITALMPQCLFNRPSQYYLKVVSGEKLLS